MNYPTNLAETVARLIEDHPEGLTAEQIVRKLLAQGISPPTVRNVLTDMIRDGKLHKVPEARLSKMIFKVNDS